MQLSGRVLVVVMVTVAAARCTQAESTEQFQQIVRPLAEGCRETEGATQSDVDQVVFRHSLDTRSSKCLLRCVYQQLGGMQGDMVGSDSQVIEAYTRVYGYHKEKMENAPQIFMACRKHMETIKDGCELAHDLLECLKQFD